MLFDEDILVWVYLVTVVAPWGSNGFISVSAGVTENTKLS